MLSPIFLLDNILTTTPNKKSQNFLVFWGAWLGEKCTGEHVRMQDFFIFQQTDSVTVIEPQGMNTILPREE